MRITIVQGGFLPVPPLLGGAVEKVWFSLGQEFAKRGHQVTHVSRLYGSLPPREGLNGVLHLRVKGFDAPRSRPLLWLKDFFYALRVAHMLPPADVLVTNTIWLPVLVRDENSGVLYVHIGRYPKRQTRMYRRAKRLHTASNAVAQAIARQDSKSKAKIRVIPYPLPNAERPVDVARTWNSRPQQILYVGRIHAEKGVHLLIDAFDRLVASGFDGWRLVIVGPWEASQGGGGSAYYRSLRRTGGSQGDRVEWLGPVFDQSLLI